MSKLELIDWATESQREIVKLIKTDDNRLYEVCKLIELNTEWVKKEVLINTIIEFMNKKISDKIWYNLIINK
jgi:hypothetical protein